MFARPRSLRYTLIAVVAAVTAGLGAPANALVATPGGPDTGTSSHMVAPPSDATAHARAELFKAQMALSLVAERYDAAQAQLTQATAALHAAQLAQVAATQRVAAARVNLGTYVSASFRSGGRDSFGAVVSLTSTPTPQEFFNGLASLDVLGQQKVSALDALTSAEQQVTDSVAAAKTATAAATHASADLARERSTLAAGVISTQALLNQAQIRDLGALSAAQDAASGDTLEAAALAVQVQALRVGAASLGQFPADMPAIRVLQVAVHALLERAAGRHTPSGVTPSAVRSARTDGSSGVQTGWPQDESRLMGPAPSFSLYPGGSPAQASTDQAPVALQPYRPVHVMGLGSAGISYGAPVQADPAGNSVVWATGPAASQLLRAEVALDAALGAVGKPYVWAAAGPATFDCSGLTQWAWGHAGVALTHFAAAQYGQGHPVSVSELLPGDLVFFDGSVGHVGMYVGAGYMVDAPHTGDYVRVQRVSDFTSSYVGGVRL